MTRRLLALALASALLAALSGCARNGLGGYEFPKITRVLP